MYWIIDNLINDDLNFLYDIKEKYESDLNEELEIGDYKHARCNFKDINLRNALWEKIKPVLRKNNIINESDDVKLSHRWYISKYFPDSGHISQHIDGNIEFEDYISKYTLLVYLNDDFQNGETVISLGDETIKVKPIKNRILIMEQNLLHSGNKPINNPKYILRSDIMFKC